MSSLQKDVIAHLRCTKRAIHRKISLYKIRKLSRCNKILCLVVKIGLFSNSNNNKKKLLISKSKEENVYEHFEVTLNTLISVFYYCLEFLSKCFVTLKFDFQTARLGKSLFKALYSNINSTIIKVSNKWKITFLVCGIQREKSFFAKREKF